MNRSHCRGKRSEPRLQPRGDRVMIFYRRPIIQRWTQDGLQWSRSSTEPHVIAVDDLGSLHSCTDAAARVAGAELAKGTDGRR